MKGIVMTVLLLVLPINAYSESDWLFWTEERSYGAANRNEPFRWIFQNAYRSWSDCDAIRSKIWKKESEHIAHKVTEPALGFYVKSEERTVEKYFYCLPVGFDPRGTTGR